MGIKGTHYITREVARQVIIDRLMRTDDEDLEGVLETFPESHFRNYKIVLESDLEELANTGEAWRVIKTLNDF